MGGGPGSALFLRTLPPARTPQSLLIFGSGAQAQAHATVFLRLFPSLTSCTIVIRRSSPRATSLLANLKTSFPNVTLSLGISTFPENGGEEPCNLSQAVHNASIILTLTPSTSPLFNSVDVCSGTHLVLVGSYTPAMREVDDNLIKRAGLVVVDSKEACAVEAGDLIMAGLGKEGMVELGEVLGSEEVRQKVMAEGDLVVFKSASLGSEACGADEERLGGPGDPRCGYSGSGARGGGEERSGDGGGGLRLNARMVIV